MSGEMVFDIRYLSILLISLSSITYICEARDDSKKVPAMYVFGGSLVDVGNSNYDEEPSFRADFPPYGVDFPTRKPTGRFSNGKLISDFLAEKLGLATAEPSLSIMKSEVSNITMTAISGGGVNFTSAGAGVLNATYPFTISLTKQVQYYSEVHEAMVQEMGPATAQQHFSKSLYPIAIGSNDLFLYFQPGSDVSKQTTPQQYVNSMLSIFRTQIKRLHDLGARKYVVLGIGMIGCIPLERAQNKNQCKVELDSWVTKYNDDLKSIMTSFNSEFKDTNYSYFDTFSAYLDIIKNPTTYAEKLGLATAEPSLSIMKSEVSNITMTAISGGGVNFASAGAGVLNATYPFTISLTKQVQYYSEVHEAMVQEMGPATAQQHFSKSLYPIAIGSNDLFLYFQPGSDVSKQTTPQQYVNSMLSIFRTQIKRLHDLGARKYVVLGVGMIGCIPLERAQNKNQCKVELDSWVTKYNDGLKSIMTSFNSEFKDINYSYFDTFSAYLDIIKNPTTYGFKEVKAACCGQGLLNAEIRCIPNSTYCSNRDDYLFWNPTLPSQKAASLFVDMMFDHSQYVTPMNVNHLVSMSN